ncbi:holliday junction ATP-dependent DNA helicase RuvA [Andreesenia angusta]|uniref:Holliday junction branch migration complex subunit RuvA n=1 Tax=Andreesenia angusta TaxID=39480 RepID=A0A1S1V852_9FIRM|nr:Holliday junction branch migration protein RuvA [Andreesenia angusta]OHW62595.1 holliday junction ATP-dependent DNA helicase RuvA [Andreesenia angusta]
MFDYIKGRVVETRGDQLVLECGGIGYLLTASYNTISKLGGKTEEVAVRTHMSVREDGVTLYGFYEYEELEMFKLLQTVSKIGPKVAIGMLSTISPSGLKKAIALSDCDLLAKAPGIGKKTAQRIVLELKDKISLDEISSVGEIDLVEVEAEYETGAEGEALDALVSLGYSKPELYSVLGKLEIEGKSSEEIIRAVLKEIGR